MTFNELFKNIIKKGGFIEKYTSLGLTSGIMARMKGQNTKGQAGYDMQEGEKQQIKTGLYKLSDDVKEVADQI
jgi:hypothetical protein